MAYLATYAAARGFNVGVLDAEAHGLGIEHTIRIINELAPRWAGFNLLAPTHMISARIAPVLTQHQDHDRWASGQGHARRDPHRPAL